MTNREIDALVAEHVMKLHPCSDPVAKCDAAKMTPCQCWGTPDRNGVVSGGELASYSTDIAAAWLVVERMQADGLIVIVTAGHQSNRTGVRVIPGCAAPFPVEDLTLHPTYQELTLGVANAETAPLAICMAALAAYGVEVSKS